MSSHKMFKRITSFLLAFLIVFSGINVIFPLETEHFIEFGQKAKAASCTNTIPFDKTVVIPINKCYYDQGGNSYPTFAYNEYIKFVGTMTLTYDGIKTLNVSLSYDYTITADGNRGALPEHRGYIGLLMDEPNNGSYWAYVNLTSTGDTLPASSSGHIDTSGNITLKNQYFYPYTFSYQAQIYFGPALSPQRSSYEHPGYTENYVGYGSDMIQKYTSFIMNREPVINDTYPHQNMTLSDYDSNFNIQMSVQDPDNDTLTCRYYIDSDTQPRDTRTIQNTAINQNVYFNPLNFGTLSEGAHTITYEISDGKATPYRNTVNVKVDKSAPILVSNPPTSTINTITLSGSATDNVSGLDVTPYRYTIGSESSGWISSNTYTSHNVLVPNTLYSTNIEVRDGKGHIASTPKNIFTKSVIPTLSVSNASSYTLDVFTSDNNPSNTQYQISLNNGSQYVTQEGNLTSAPVWITLPNKMVNIKGLSPNSTYTFIAKARNGENIETTVSSAVTGTTLVAPPGSPANIIATATDKTITVSWDAVNGSIGYDIEADGVIIDNGTATTYTHRNLNPGTPHKYKVRAKNAGGTGNWSVDISKSTLPGSPDIPQNLNTIPLSTSVTVTWNNVPGATGYDIEVDGTLVNNGPNTSYIHNSLTPGTHHSYRVRSINPGGKSEWSNYVNVTTSVDSTQVPVNITATPSINKIVLSWDPVDGSTGYDIEVDGITFDNSNRTIYTHSNLVPGTQHIYRVRAKKGSKNSEWSSMVVSSTLTNSFGTPANFKAIANDTSIALTWDVVPEAEGYDVEINGTIADNGMETSCTHNGLMPNTTYTYKVRAKKGSETSEWTQPLTVTTFRLQTPQNVTTLSDETSITVNWSPVNGATSYDLEFDGSIITDISSNLNSGIQTTTDSAISYSIADFNIQALTTTDAAISTTQLATESISTIPAITAVLNSASPTTYTITGLSPNTQHTIKVRAVNESGTSNWSTQISQSTRFTTGNIPNLSGLVKKTSIAVMWNPIEGAESYDVEVDGVITSNVTGSSYNSTGLVPGTQHKYRVRAKNSSGAGEWSNTFSVSTLSEGPATPTNVVTSGNMTSILITWDKVAGSEEYEIEIDGTLVISTGMGTSYLHTGLTPDTSHNYRVRAKSISAYSEWSTTKTSKTLSSVQTYQVESTQGEEFDLVLTATNIQDLDAYTFTIQYDTDDFEVVDLCGLTAKVNSVEGDISGTDITVTQVAPGTIVFTKNGSAESWQVWSGVVNSITFKAKKDGNSTITYTLQ